MSRFSFFEEHTTTEPSVEQKHTEQASSPGEFSSPPIDEVRYRCEQLNVTRVEQRIVSHATTKKEYLMQKYPNNRVNTTLVDYHYEVEPKRLGIALDAMKEMEYIKETAQFRLNNENEIVEVLNLMQMSDQWNAHRMQLKGSEFFKTIQAHSQKAAEDILNAGDLEFKNQENIKATYDRVMLYHILFNNFIDINKKRTLNFISQVFVNIPVEVLLSNKIKSQNEETIVIQTTGQLNRDKLKLAEIQAQYDLYYKPAIKYGFTDYVYEYDIIRTIEKSTGNIIEASAILSEGVKNNYSTTTECSLKQVKL